MARKYRHLSQDDRRDIGTLKRSKCSIRGIARQLERAPSTISRELRRNCGGNGYRYKQANEMALKRRSLASSRARRMELVLG